MLNGLRAAVNAALIEARFPELIRSDLPSRCSGTDGKFKKVRHGGATLSDNNAPRRESDVVDFTARIPLSENWGRR